MSSLYLFPEAPIPLRSEEALELAPHLCSAAGKQPSSSASASRYTMGSQTAGTRHPANHHRRGTVALELSSEKEKPAPFCKQFHACSPHRFCSSSSPPPPRDAALFAASFQAIVSLLSVFKRCNSCPRRRSCRERALQSWWPRSISQMSHPGPAGSSMEATRAIPHRASKEWVRWAEPHRCAAHPPWRGQSRAAAPLKLWGMTGDGRGAGWLSVLQSGEERHGGIARPGLAPSHPALKPSRAWAAPDQHLLPSHHKSPVRGEDPPKPSKSSCPLWMSLLSPKPPGTHQGPADRAPWCDCPLSTSPV